ncbi:MAG: type II toxin-antitoxin system VapC family toxin [Ilumatobacteraceae bacterium]|nr:MAG: type II toxin-antitoxin system VapC family toxin [Actinomycetota bacterium]
MAAGTLVDSNVLLDIFTEDPAWVDWSSRSLSAAAESGPLFVNPIVYAEVSVRFSRVEDLEDALPASEFRRAPLPWAAAFLAGKAFTAYRRSQGGAPVPLPDFYIGAHAAVDGLALLTRDGGRYRTYFPTLELITPQP